MKPVLLIAANFVRENRWPMITLVLYVVVFGLAMTLVGNRSGEDVVFFLRSVGVYGLAFTGLLASSAINNERRSRRILAVLSKAVERGEYLAGLLLGTMFDAAVYCAAIGAIGTVSLSGYHAPVVKVWELAALLMAAFLLVATVAMFFSTMFHPMLAAALAAVTLAGAGIIAQVLGPPWPNLLPGYTLASTMVNFGFVDWQVPWPAIAAALVESVVFWIAATVVFARRDIAVAVE